ncbi:MAG: phosphatase PAP2 family protein [Candidatus Nealsonbacteria bacterium]|nr:phosphatase PAP2 family protein [Candidatus Nealsonbacteria bacterium]
MRKDRSPQDIRPTLAGAPGNGTRRSLVLLGVLLAATVAALAIDCPLARWCLEMPAKPRKTVADLLYMFEPFGHGVGVAMIVLAIHQLDAARRWALPRVLACSFGAGLAANVVKMTVLRTRPSGFDFDGGVWATFGGWFPLASVGRAGQSFPSAHTATAVGLAVALIWLYPAGRKLFITLAVLVAAQRVQTGAHYLSDVLAASALAIGVSIGCLKAGRLADWFDRLEQRFSGEPRGLPPRPSASS